MWMGIKGNEKRVSGLKDNKSLEDRKKRSKGEKVA